MTAPAFHPGGDDAAAGDVIPHDSVVIEEALTRLPDDVGAIYEPAVIAALARLRITDRPRFLRLRQRIKQTNAACSLAELDEAVRQVNREAAEPSAADSVLDDLIALARAECILCHDGDRQAVAIVPLADRREVWRLDSSGYQDWLRGTYWRRREAGVAETTLKAALATLTAAGVNEGEQVNLHLRAARVEDGYCLDLCDENWRAIQITARGWSLFDTAPVLFTRSPTMRALPIPDRAGADLDLLWRHVNIPPPQRLLVLAWLLDCLRPNTPFPVLELVGEQGSAKSTTQAMLRSLIDPNKVMLRGRPKSVEDIFVAAANNWLVSYENLSGLTPEQQDALCTLATGGGFAARQLYTNGEEHVLATKRPAVLNGIAAIATRPDLIDRVIHIDMPAIAPEDRRDDAETQSAWEQDRPKIFAALLDLFAATLAMLPKVHLTQRQRMSDYERLGEAMACALRHPRGTFQKIYAAMVHAGTERVLDGNPVAQALDKFLRATGLPWQGTAGVLYEQLTVYSGADRSNWPRSPKGLADQLRRIAPAYRARGIDIGHRGHQRDGAVWRISRIAEAEEQVLPTPDTTVSIDDLNRAELRQLIEARNPRREDADRIYNDALRNLPASLRRWRRRSASKSPH